MASADPAPAAAADTGAGERPAVKVRHDEWARAPGIWRGHVPGIDLGANVTILFYETTEIGNGPRLHVHPYDEVFIVREGRGRFFVGDTVIDAEAGDVLMGPANVPHKFINRGPGKLATTDVHLNDRWIQTNLEDDA